MVWSTRWEVKEKNIIACIVSSKNVISYTNVSGFWTIEVWNQTVNDLVNHFRGIASIGQMQLSPWLLILKKDVVAVEAWFINSGWITACFKTDGKTLKMRLLWMMLCITGPVSSKASINNYGGMGVLRRAWGFHT